MKIIMFLLWLEAKAFGFFNFVDQIVDKYTYSSNLFKFIRWNKYESFERS